MTIETTYTDEDVLRAHNAEIPSPAPEPTGHSKSVMAAFRRAKKASIQNDKRSQRIVGSLNRERVNDCNNVAPLHVAKHSQSSIMDY